MTGTEAIKVSAVLAEMADPWVKKMEVLDLSGQEKAAAVKGMVRVLVFGASTLSPAVSTLFAGVSVTQVDAMIDVAIAALVAMYKAVGLFISRVKDALR